MDTLDRLLSAAGGVAVAADRFTDQFRRTGARGRPGRGAAVVAGSLWALAILFLAVGAETTDGGAPRRIGPAIGAGSPLGEHAYVTVSGLVSDAYSSHYFDLDGDGSQDAGEADSDFVYLVRDPGSDDALVVISTRPPSSIFTVSLEGVVREDPAYIAEDLPHVQGDLDRLGISLDRTRYVDARDAGPATGASFDLSGDLPVGGTPIVVGGSVLTWTYTCAAVGSCEPANAESFDLLVYDPAARRAVVVVTRQSPTWTSGTFTGIVRRAEHEVSEALDPAMFDLAAIGVTVGRRYLLIDGTTPTSPLVAWILAAVCALGGALIVVGLAAGPLMYRRSAAAVPSPARSLAPGEGLPLRVTGRLRTPSGDATVRESPAELVRFVTHGSAARPTTPGEADGPEPPSTLIVERRGRAEGAPLGPTDVTGLSLGDVFPLRGRRPAIRVRTERGPLLLSFDTVSDRDRAAAELLWEHSSGAEMDPTGADRSMNEGG